MKREKNNAMSNNNYDTLLSQIKKNKDNNRLSHAIIIHGTNENGRKYFVREAIKQILGGDEKTNRKIDDGNFEDLLIVSKDGDSIKVPQIEEMVTEFKNKPFSSELMIALIEDGDFITESSQNKLLKTLEEPSPGYIIFILVSNPELLTETIRSRCVTMRLQDDLMAVDEDCTRGAKKVLSMTLFQKVALSKIFDEMGQYENRYIELLTAMKLFLRDIVVGSRNENLIANNENAEIVKKISNKNESLCRKCIYIIEDALVKISKGMNTKYIIRDMAVRIRQEANNG